jgi:hypothetical protein
MSFLKPSSDVFGSKPHQSPDLDEGDHPTHHQPAQV